jgi:hypothetical protein
VRPPSSGFAEAVRRLAQRGDGVADGVGEAAGFVLEGRRGDVGDVGGDRPGVGERRAEDFIQMIGPVVDVDCFGLEARFVGLADAADVRLEDGEGVLQLGGGRGGGD